MLELYALKDDILPHFEEEKLCAEYDAENNNVTICDLSTFRRTLEEEKLLYTEKNMY